MLNLLRRIQKRAENVRDEKRRRGRRGQRGMTLIEIMLVLAILATVMGVLFGPTLIGMFSESKDKAAKILVEKYAMQAYVQWQTNNDDDCPGTIDELNRYLGREDAKDPFGKTLIMLCGDNLPPEAEAHGIGILSMGKDKKQGTKDDIMSWKKLNKK